MIGAACNIGRPLVAHLRAMGYAVLEVDLRPGWRPDYLMADITQPLDLLPAFDWAPDVVFLLRKDKDSFHKTLVALRWGLIQA